MGDDTPIGMLKAQYKTNEAALSELEEKRQRSAAELQDITDLQNKLLASNTELSSAIRMLSGQV